MQKTTLHLRAVKRLVNGLTRHDQRQRQIPTADAFGQANEVRPNARLFRRKKSTGAPAAHGNFIANQVHLVLVTQLAHPRHITGVVHDHARRTLHQGLQDNRGDSIRATLQQLFQILSRLRRCFLGPFWLYLRLSCGFN